MIIRLVRKPIGMLSAFVSAVSVNDTSTKFDTEYHDEEIDRIARGMNSLTSMFSKSRQELETRKLYYDRILKVMTHEMRNSITPIQSLSSAITDHPSEYDDAETKEAFSLIRSQSENIIRFLDSYHALTHIPQPEKSVIDGISFISRLKQTVTAIAARYPGGNDCVSFTIATGATLYGDEGLLTQALTNLIKNAIESTVSSAREKREKSDTGYTPQVSVVLTSKDERTIITIEDNGNGLADKIARDPFQPFVSTKKSGSGIGMFISRQIIIMHGGKISLYNNPGKGVMIKILIPFSRSSSD